jgi:hypothetical protein
VDGFFCVWPRQLDGAYAYQRVHAGTSRGKEWMRTNCRIKVGSTSHSSRSNWPIFRHENVRTPIFCFVETLNVLSILKLPLKVYINTQNPVCNGLCWFTGKSHNSGFGLCWFWWPPNGLGTFDGLIFPLFLGIDTENFGDLRWKLILNDVIGGLNEKCGRHLESQSPLRKLKGKVKVLLI